MSQLKKKTPFIVVVIVACSCTITDTNEINLTNIKGTRSVFDENGYIDVEAAKAAQEIELTELAKNAQKKVDINGQIFDPQKDDQDNKVMLSKKFQKKLSNMMDEDDVEVDFFFRLPQEELNHIIQSNVISAKIVGGKQKDIIINGKSATENDLKPSI